MLVVVGGAACGSGDEKSDSTFAQARARMVQRQIASRGISDQRVLEALCKVERHRYVPKTYRSFAYDDTPLPIGYDQTISQPYIVALMTELADVDSTDRVLEIGTGSGYQAAILSLLASEVFTIEIVQPLADSAKARLSRLGYSNVTVRAGDGFRGWEEEAPFDAIVVTCAPEEIPPPLIDQLADSGRLVIPVGDMWQELILLTRDGDKINRQSVAPVRFVPMTGEAER
ncbi:MAG: protein-L-isoaspartate(D-aspartate) O-methyltransferase [Candidatus Zixiibacteriota bacterium]|nr:MAG: protein-L-isoaspartate(D-aspartate) O-methyltransferase [candidate division Zixibacteria bacterium]